MDKFRHSVVQPRNRQNPKTSSVNKISKSSENTWPQLGEAYVTPSVGYTLVTAGLKNLIVNDLA